MQTQASPEDANRESGTPTRSAKSSRGAIAGKLVELLPQEIVMPSEGRRAFWP